MQATLFLKIKSIYTKIGSKPVSAKIINNSGIRGRASKKKMEFSLRK
jgi:hypothetical protein